MSLKDYVANSANLTHEDIYGEIIKMLGEDELVELIPFSEKQVAEALSTGDVHLNTLPLKVWDSMYEQVKALGRKYAERLAKEIQDKVYYSMSLAESVCILKQTARRRYYNRKYYK